MRVFLIHGGIWEDMDAEKMWHAPGVTAGLTDAGFEVVTPDRLKRPVSWQADFTHVASQLPAGPSVVVAASNACTSAVKLAALYGDQVTKLLLTWPATCGDTARDARFATALTDMGADRATIEDILAGQTLRGVTDTDLAGLRLPVGVIPAPADSPSHQRHTVDALLGLIEGATALPVFYESPHPGFASQRQSFIDAVADWIGRPAATGVDEGLR